MFNITKNKKYILLELKSKKSELYVRMNEIKILKFKYFFYFLSKLKLLFKRNSHPF